MDGWIYCLKIGSSMSSFLKWNNTEDLKMPVKAVLVLDNVPAYPDGLQFKGEPEIKCYFLPPCVTSLIQFMTRNQQVLQKQLFSDILWKMESAGSELVDVLKTMNIKDVIYIVTKSFEDVLSSTIGKSYKKAWSAVQEAVEKK